MIPQLVSPMCFISHNHWAKSGSGHLPPGNNTRPLLWAMITSLLFSIQLNALTMGDLLQDPKMTPKRFADLFEDFQYVLQPFDVQNPEVFLSTRSGDCIDYAVLADYVLKKKGYGTRLIRVEMIGLNVGHAICYVTENRAYLDYNNRRYFFKLQRCGPTIREIASEVADSFDANWTFAMEFTYDYKEDVKRPVYTVVKTDPPASDPDVVQSRSKPNG